MKPTEFVEHILLLKPSRWFLYDEEKNTLLEDLDFYFFFKEGYLVVGAGPDESPSGKQFFGIVFMYVSRTEEKVGPTYTFDVKDLSKENVTEIVETMISGKDISSELFSLSI